MTKWIIICRVRNCTQEAFASGSLEYTSTSFNMSNSSNWLVRVSFEMKMERVLEAFDLKNGILPTGHSSFRNLLVIVNQTKKKLAGNVKKKKTTAGQSSHWQLTKHPLNFSYTRGCSCFLRELMDQFEPSVQVNNKLPLIFC